MRIQLNYFAQIRQAAGVESETFTLQDGTTIAQALTWAADQHGDTFLRLILTESSQLRPSIILLVNGVPVVSGVNHVLKEGDTLSLFSPVAGG